MTASGLAGLRVLVTRPAHQAQAQCDALEGAGAQVVRLPLISIEAPRREAVVRDALQAASTDDWWLFTSPNAVFWAKLLSATAPQQWPQRLAAAGRGTAAAVAGIGRPDVLCPTRDGAAGLLALPELVRAGAGTRVTVICGERSPTWLADGLRQSGIQLRLVNAYRRVPVAHEPARVRECLQKVDAAIVTSGGALKHLCALIAESSRPRLFGLQLALPSKRVVEMAHQFGFRDPPLVPERVSDEGFVQVLMAWHQGNAEAKKGT